MAYLKKYLKNLSELCSFIFVKIRFAVFLFFMTILKQVWYCSFEKFEKSLWKIIIRVLKNRLYYSCSLT